MNKRMSYSRKGGALIMALMVVLGGGALIAATFEMVFIYSWFTQEQRSLYVDHTILASYIQEIKAQIIAYNLGKGEILHAPDILTATGPTLTVEDLRFKDEDFESPSSLSQKLNVPFDTTNPTGVGPRKVEVEVYDMVFNPNLVNWDEYDPDKFFPPVMNRLRHSSTTCLGENGVEGTPCCPVADRADLRGYGAYLIRVMLYDARLFKPRRGGDRPIRIIEEAFVQILDPEPS